MYLKNFWCTTSILCIENINKTKLSLFLRKNKDIQKLAV